ncbi:MAG: hypothetical protein J0I34_02495 [Pseudonocardia sp.]|uniref:hypothetical protein n=1 Tax=unclassified Pseudonocardia TaxID=2619320 RepID=UPI00086E0BC9|nr:MULTISPECIES: hypothetical protein [unclassified Pseudonocardia]MBN9107627.1 hypothetical protein [Pseudonocardia sp.]ODV08472.1 MAG: hypothetical protein ABT15_04210 [Pseudonocardia sp. SCN 73-27]RTL63524.1 MAG: hypothetical protein EKK42_28315 [Pseudonocardiaceae bacterium]
MIVLTVVVIVLLIAGLAFYLFRVGTLLTRIATNLETCEESVQQVNRDAALIGPGVEHINRSGGTLSGALPLVYGMAEQIVGKVSPTPVRPAVAVPAAGRRRSRLFDGVGYAPR